ncbi:hypothetical protein [Arthrobacter sp. MMS18-M83]|uniref:hypothetical protein n=1 Tax=Arthrobacter sp. MMS18-M83 TaxID=2996261 RepID=UPI00227B7A9F|nr:hypothetical protein [Arthrobacter sp. MMS18-M83]WAH97440.1 hypothetical protein OW521_00580 [Arthrobacter sp. MMS18-M83]
MAAAKSMSSPRRASLAAAVGLPALIKLPNNQSEATWARQDQDARLTLGTAVDPERRVALLTGHFDGDSMVQITQRNPRFAKENAFTFTNKFHIH